MNQDPLFGLLEALAVSPQNLPLRKHVIGQLLANARDAEAAEVCRAGLTHAPGDFELELLLADSFRRAGRIKEALVLAEKLARGHDERAGLLLVRLMLADRDIEGARAAYRRLKSRNADLTDAAIEQALGIDRESPPAPPLFAGDMPERPDRARAEVQRPDLNFAHVGGMAFVKDQIHKRIVAPLRNPELFAAYGRKAGGGILLYGPPGCGKTHMARATAGEVNAAFMSIGISDVLDMYVGESERNLHQLFEQARASTPCVLFFDEVDALGASRSDLRQSTGRQLINQFLSELDGVHSRNDGVLVLAATNAPWHMDPAFRRPGRFDRVVFVPPPDEPARAEILRIMLHGKPVADIDYDGLAAKAREFSGADLRAVVEMAIEEKIEASMASGRPEPITGKELLKAIKARKPTTREWFATARNYAMFSNQGGHYDDVLHYLKLK